MNSVSGADWIWVTTRLAIYARDGWKCLACQSAEKLSLDHVKPTSQGGSNRPRNLITICFSCNSSRGSKPIRAWRPDLVPVVRRHVRRRLNREAARALALELRPSRVLGARERMRRGPISVAGCPF